MGDSMRKVRSGDPLDIPASTFNTFIDAARYFRERQAGSKRNGNREILQNGIVLVKNTNGADCERFHVLGINEPIILPSDNEDEFKNKVAFNVNTPNEDNHKGKFVILLEPIKNGAIGKAMCCGICTVKISVTKEKHSYAEISNGETSYLKSAKTGAAQILWKESGTGTKWAIVRLSIPEPTGTCDSPYELPVGEGNVANTETWDITEQPEGHDGVTYTPFRVYYDNVSNFYSFVRKPKYDNLGRLVYVGPEESGLVFTTVDCDCP
jgi:hypothetical protein